mmetsp:Transcript_61181/g.162591  ORF Transcript_61181/g.162591 Transcript_61181/m.162591 type:complete len:184 (-) Transcript_61181:115-666(-)
MESTSSACKAEWLFTNVQAMMAFHVGEEIRGQERSQCSAWYFRLPQLPDLDLAMLLYATGMHEPASPSGRFSSVGVHLTGTGADDVQLEVKLSLAEKGREVASTTTSNLGGRAEPCRFRATCHLPWSADFTDDIMRCTAEISVLIPEGVAGDPVSLCHESSWERTVDKGRAGDSEVLDGSDSE